MPRTQYKAVVDSLSDEIRRGRLTPGARLPTHRELARTHGFALATATRVYSELQSMGLVCGETGRGTFVREPRLSLEHGLDQQAVAEGVLDLAFNSSVLPGQTELLREGLRRLASGGDLDALLRYQPHLGRPHERSLIAAHLARHGVHAPAEQIAVVSGAQHGLAVTALALLRPGDLVAVDALTYPGIKVVAQACGLELAPLPVDSRGTDLQALQALCRKRKPRAVYSMPTLHNPLGCVMGKQARQELVALARQHDLLLLEDAAYAFLVEDAPPALFEMAPERCVHLSGLSKSVATGLRFGFLAAPKDCMPRIERAIRATTWSTPPLVTALCCAWMQDGTVESLEHQHRQDAFQRQKLVGQCLHGFRKLRHPHGYFVWLPMEEGLRADRVVQALSENGITASSAEPFATTPQAPHALRLALGTVPMDRLKESLIRARKVMGRVAGA
jgi:DNA-binding transcriptional MocR family regulator